MNGLDLFSGIGGLTLALSEWVKPVAYCEIDPYCQGVLLSRMANELLPNCPIWNDIRTLSGLPFNGSIDIIYGGFPCQDISIAGHGKGLEGERSGLFFEIVSLAKEIKPRFIFLENVPAITNRGGLQVVNEITSLGYDCRWCIISAASVGALHRRERWFLLAHSIDNGTFAHKNGESLDEITYEGQQYQHKENIGEIERTSTISSNVANICNNDSEPSEQTHKKAISHQTIGQSWGGSARLYWPLASVDHWQKTVSEMDKCSDGIPYNVDRLRALGNSVVPEQAKEAFKILMGLC